MLPVPKMSRKGDFYTDVSGGLGPSSKPGTKPVKSVGRAPSPTPPADKPAPSLPGKASVNKLAEFFGADSEPEVDKLLTQVKDIDSRPNSMRRWVMIIVIIILVFSLPPLPPFPFFFFSLAFFFLLSSFFFFPFLFFFSISFLYLSLNYNLA